MGNLTRENAVELYTLVSKVRKRYSGIRGQTRRECLSQAMLSAYMDHSIEDLDRMKEILNLEWSDDGPLLKSNPA